MIIYVVAFNIEYNVTRKSKAFHQEKNEKYQRGNERKAGVRNLGSMKKKAKRKKWKRFKERKKLEKD